MAFGFPETPAGPSQSWALSSNCPLPSAPSPAFRDSNTCRFPLRHSSPYLFKFASLFTFLKLWVLLVNKKASIFVRELRNDLVVPARQLWGDGGTVGQGGLEEIRVWSATFGFKHPDRNSEMSS
ncbi:hypothetical protein RRG08_055765 [Elysia crispata]|uniref:Uncharacterized protein n=1 Tax=Elysia crispata TaxID=231223 RepID=A0AAE1ABL4_9GAST|nr:hypothetical protein RRG08_055765 [Elysia crispata]